MNTHRILSQHGKVIAADFRPRPSFDLSVTFKTETLYSDGIVMLTRTTANLGGKPLATVHHLGDLPTGQFVQLTNKDVTS